MRQKKTARNSDMTDIHVNTRLADLFIYQTDLVPTQLFIVQRNECVYFF
jgi:hypothetical protein